MTETKYGKYFVREPFSRGGPFPILAVHGAKDFAGANLSIRIHYQTEPYLMIKEPHKHDFDQFYCLMGGDLANVHDFGAVIELFLGEEGEKHIINTTTCLHIPKGLIHGPLEFKIVEKPVILIDILAAPEYSTVPIS